MTDLLLSALAADDPDAFDRGELTAELSIEIASLFVGLAELKGVKGVNWLVAPNRGAIIRRNARFGPSAEGTELLSTHQLGLHQRLIQSTERGVKWTPVFGPLGTIP